MFRLTKFLALVSAVAIFAMPVSAFAESIVPPGNSAVNQYTQTFPTSGGNVAVKGSSIKVPAQVLGSQATHKLDQQGPEGKAAAELAASSTPSTGVAAPAPEPEGGDAEEEGRQRSQGGGGGGPGGAPPPASAAPGPGPGPKLAAPGGSSGLGQILGQATGSSSSGELGLLMPLALLCGIAWCVVYLRRQKQHPA